MKYCKQEISECNLLAFRPSIISTVTYIILGVTLAAIFSYRLFSDTVPFFHGVIPNANHFASPVAALSLAICNVLRDVFYLCGTPFVFWACHYDVIDFENREVRTGVPLPKLSSAVTISFDQIALIYVYKRPGIFKTTFAVCILWKPNKSKSKGLSLVRCPIFSSGNSLFVYEYDSETAEAALRLSARIGVPYYGFVENGQFLELYKSATPEQTELVK